MKSRLKLPKRELVRFQLTLESYEGIFYVSTDYVNKSDAYISVFVPDDLWVDGQEILEKVREEIPYEDVI